MNKWLRFIAVLLVLCIPVVSFAQEQFQAEDMKTFLVNCSIGELLTIRDLLTQEIANREEAGQSAIVYILNINTDKFHSPECKSTKQIKEKNRVEYSGSRELLVTLGFTPCSICHP